MKNDNLFAWNETIQKLNSDESVQREPECGCECCACDVALFWQDATNNAFVDSKGEVLVTAKDHTLRFKVKCCPNCGRKFD